MLDGRDITHAPPNEIAALGIVQMPGGQGVFGSLTVKENLELAGWTNRRDPAGVEAATAEVLAMFPVLADRLDSPAANMSGGQQQMLALAMSFVMRPKVLLIDELSLGLAPVVVGQLLPIVRRMADDGVTVVLVEQSVNVALTVAERAYFMERGTIRFDGPTAELLERPDLLRSVFLSAAHARRRRRRLAAPTIDRSTRSGRHRPDRSAGAVGQRVVGHLRRDSRRQRRLVRRVAPRDRGRDRPERRRQDHRVRPDLRLHPPRRGPDRAQRPQHHRPELRRPGGAWASGVPSRTPACSPS